MRTRRLVAGTDVIWHLFFVEHVPPFEAHNLEFEAHNLDKQDGGERKVVLMLLLGETGNKTRLKRNEDCRGSGLEDAWAGSTPSTGTSPGLPEPEQTVRTRTRIVLCPPSLFDG
jgi:hypothetical protein